MKQSEQGTTKDQVSDISEPKPGPQPPTHPYPEPVRRSYSRDELLDSARKYMVSSYGVPLDMDDESQKNRWRERYGLLVDFVINVWVRDE